MDAFSITVIGMAGGAILNDAGFVSLPWGQVMDISVALLAFDIVQEVNACIVLRALLFVATMTGHRFGLNLATFRFFAVAFNVKNIPVAAIAGEGAVDGLNERFLRNRVPLEFGRRYPTFRMRTVPRPGQAQQEFLSSQEMLTHRHRTCHGQGPTQR